MSLNIARKLKTPKVNVPHFAARVKQFRGDNIDFLSGVCDIIDNVLGLAKVNKEKYEQRINFRIFGNKIFKIEFSDNVSHGFRDITRDNELNPFNMGHMREGHSNDDETSEYGVGMKKTMIYVAEKAEVYTRCVNEEGVNYCKIEMDFREMTAKKDPSESYEYTQFDYLTQDQFISRKPDDVGSLIILSEIISSNLGEPLLNTEEEVEIFLSKFRDGLSSIFRGVLGRHIDIYVNDTKVEPYISIKDRVTDDNKTFIDLNINMTEKNIKEMYFHNKTKDTWGVFDEKTKKINKLGKKEAELRMDKKKFVVVRIFCCLDQDKNDMYEGETEMIRDGRSFGKIKITKKQTDGYSNYIYSSIEWKHKSLNNFFGLSTSKTVIKKENNLYAAITKELTLVENEYRRKYQKANNTEDEPEHHEERPEEPVKQTTTTTTNKPKTKLKIDPEETDDDEPPKDVYFQDEEETDDDEPSHEVVVKEESSHEETEDDDEPPREVVKKEPVVKNDEEIDNEVKRVIESRFTLEEKFVNELVNKSKDDMKKIIYSILRDVSTNKLRELMREI